MKIVRIVQVSLILLFGVLCFTIGIGRAPRGSSSASMLVSEADQAGVYFRFNVYPRGGYYYYNRPYRYYYRRSEVNITVKQDQSSGERIRDLYLDDRRIPLNSPTARGYRGSFFFQLNPGSHIIEWTYVDPDGEQRQVYRQFNVGYGQRLNFFISGDQFYQR